MCSSQQLLAGSEHYMFRFAFPPPMQQSQNRLKIQWYSLCRIFQRCIIYVMELLTCLLLFWCVVSKARRLFCNSNLWCSQHGLGEEPRSWWSGRLQNTRGHEIRKPIRTEIWCGGALGTLPTFGGLQSRTCTRGHCDGHDANIQDSSQELVQQAHILKAQIPAIWDVTQCNRLTRGDRIGGGREAEGDCGFYIPIGEVSRCLGS